MEKIFVTGNTGAGKTTLSKEVARRLHLKVYSLDTIVWKSGGTMATPEERRLNTKKLIDEDSWVIDGVCSKTFEAAEVIIFMDLPLHICLKNVILRFFKNGLKTRPGLPEDCPEYIGVLKSLKIAFIYQRLSRPKILNLIQKNSSSKKIITIKSHKEINAILGALL